MNAIKMALFSTLLFSTLPPLTSLAEDSFGMPALSATSLREGRLMLAISISQPARDAPEASRILYAVNSPEFRSAIRLTDRQYRDFISIQRTIDDRFDQIRILYSQKMYSDSVGVEIARAALAEEANCEATILNTLSEQQLVLARQYFEREKLRRLGAFEYLTSPEMSAKLEITSAQRRTLQQRWNEILGEVIRSSESEVLGGEFSGLPSELMRADLRFRQSERQVNH